MQVQIHNLPVENSFNKIWHKITKQKEINIGVAVWYLHALPLNEEGSHLRRQIEN